MNLDATPGGSSANSYATVVEADAYFSTSFNRTAWASAGNVDKAVVLIEASRLLDTLVKWNGYLSSNTQALRWPRAWVYDPDSYPAHRSNMDSGLGGPYLASDVIPKPIKEIAYELAYSILSTDGFSSVENDITRVKVGSILVDFSQKVKNQGFPQVVRDMIVRWGEYEVRSSNSIQQVGLSRV